MFVADVTNIIATPSTTTNYEGVEVNYLTQDDSIDLLSGIIKVSKSEINNRKF